MTKNMTNAVAPITIGLPVYNGASTLRPVLDSLLAQTWTDFELIISDNASTDDTSRICMEYSEHDERVRYVRQPCNIGAEANFRYVLDVAESEFFMWAAADDVRSPDFLERNLAFLRANPEYVASTSPTRFEGKGFNLRAMGDAPLIEEDRYQRLVNFFDAWHANGRFYALFKRDAVSAWHHLGQSFLGADWTLVTHLAVRGKINRLEEGWVELGTGGASNATDIFAYYRAGLLDWIIPFNRLTADTWRLMSGAPLRQRMIIAMRLMRLNLQAFALQFRVMATRKSAAR